MRGSNFVEGGEDKGDNGKNDLSLVHQAKKHTETNHSVWKRRTLRAVKENDA